MSSPFLALPASAHVASNALAFAIRDAYPVSPGHTLVVPRRLVATWFEASAEERVAIFALVDELKAQLDASHAPDGYNVGFNAGEAAGQTVMHLHVHVIPRYRGDMDDPRGGVRHAIPSRGNYLREGWGAGRNRRRQRPVDGASRLCSTGSMAGDGMGCGVFRHLAIKHAKLPPSDTQIAAIEHLLRATLPESFLAFLRVANGGTLEYVVDVPLGEGQVTQIGFEQVFSAEDEEGLYETFLEEIRMAREHHGVPEGVLPFARDGGGCVAYLDLTPEGRGRVVAFVSGELADPGFVELAPSFDAYVEALRVDRGAVLDHLAHDADELEDVAAIVAYLDIGLPGWRTDEGLRSAVAAARTRLGG